MYTRESLLTDTSGAAPAAWDAALAAKGVQGGNDIVTVYETLCGVAGLSADLAMAQACQETGWFSSVAWLHHNNPAGIGITSDAVEGPHFPTVADGVRAHIALLCCYALGSDPEPVAAWNALAPYGFGGFHRAQPALSSLEGHWDEAAGYAQEIADIANSVRGQGPPAGAAVVTPEMIVAAAMKHVGEGREWDSWNGDHAVSMLCEADAEDWYTEAGLMVPHYGSAKASAQDGGMLSVGEPALGAQIWMAGPGWSDFWHTGIYIGGGRVISGLATVVVSTGWLDLAAYQGWRLPAGVSNVSPLRVADGNPYGAIPMAHPFSSRWYQLDGMGLALPQMGWPKSAESVTAAGRRVQRFERGWYGVQLAAAPWDLVALLPAEWPVGG